MFVCIRVISLYTCPNGRVTIISLYMSHWVVHQCHLLYMSQHRGLEYSIIFLASLLHLVVIASTRYALISSISVSLRIALDNYLCHNVYLSNHFISFACVVSCAHVEEMNLYLFGQCTKLGLVGHVSLCPLF